MTTFKEQEETLTEELRELTRNEPMADPIWDSPLNPLDKSVALAAMTTCYGGIDIPKIAEITEIDTEQCDGILRYHAQRLGRSRLAVEFLRAYWETRSEHAFARLIIPEGDRDHFQSRGDFENMLPTFMHFVALSHYDGRNYSTDPVRSFYWKCTNAGFYRVASDSDSILMQNGNSYLRMMLENFGAWDVIYQRGMGSECVRVAENQLDTILRKKHSQNFSQYHFTRERSFRMQAGKGPTLLQVARHVSDATFHKDGE
jgi:hypothetical protein